MLELTPFARRHAVSSYDPFREMNRFAKEFWGDHSLMEFKTDIRDTGKAYELEADLPGFKKENIHLDIEDSCLTIRAERHAEKEEKDEKGNVLRSERSFGSFVRSFDISNVQEDGIKASYNNGVLKLVMPKKDTVVPESRRIEIQ